MKTVTIMTLMFLAMGAVSQDVVHSPTHGQCTFSDGSSLSVRYQPEQRSYRLSTTEPLLTTQGTSIPAGDYTAYLEKDFHHHWTIKMMKPIGGKALFIVSSPMSVTTSALPIENPEVSFDQTGRRCTLQLNREQSDTILSMGFTKRNLDLAGLQ